MNRRTRIRHKAAVFVAAVIVITGALAVPLTVLAADGPYTIDGTVPDTTPATTELPDESGNVKELGPLNSNTTKIGVIHSDAVPTLGKTNPNGQVDLRRAWLDTERESGKDWLYFAWERDANSGSGFIAYEFMAEPAPAACDYEDATEADLIADCNPWANRQAGDFMILWDQQGGSLDLFLRIWSGTAPNLVLGAPEELDDLVSDAAYSADGFRGEAAVNLTDTVFGGSTACRSIANTIPSTVTGNSDTADYKDTILTTTPPFGNCTTTTVTTPQTGAGATISGPLSIGTGVVAVRDSAVVSLQGGTATPSGSVSFWLCKLDSPDLCDGTTGKVGTAVGSTDLTGTSYPATVQSPTAYVTSVGRYCWRAVFSGDTDSGIGGSSDATAGECFTVDPVTPTLSTDAGDGGNVGSAVTDQATLGGTATQPANPVINLTGTAGAAAGGTITFKLYGPNDCTTVAYTSPTVAVSGNNTYNTPAPQFVPTAAGDYHWVAIYSGSSPNTSGVTHNAACTDTAEDVTVTTVPTSLTSQQRWTPNDSVTVTAPAGTGNLNGVVTFTLYGQAACAGASLYSTTAAVSGASPQTVATNNTTFQTTSGTYSWKVSYDSMPRHG